jgi:uncharacterized protein (DUF58 family)
VKVDNPQQFLDPSTLAKVRNLEFRARLIVEGYLSGMHASPYHGFSVEFAQHREYVAGDDIKHLDWKVYARTGRYYLKQYEQDSNLVCWLLMDQSESMLYRSGPVSKYEYCCMIGAALAYLVLHQQDSVGMATFDDRIRHLVPPSSQASHLYEIAKVLDESGARERTRLAPIFHEMAERVRRRSVMVILSDLLDDVPDLLKGLRHFRHNGHEVIVFHVLDPAELDFPFQTATLFRGLERLPALATDPRSVRSAYLDELQSYLQEIERGCGELEVDYVRLGTNANLGVALSAYLGQRRARAK